MASSDTELDCAYDERTKPGYVHIKMKIKGIKPSKGGIFGGKGKDGNKPKAENARFEGPTYGDKSYSLRIIGEKELNGLDKTMRIQQLPYKIKKDESMCEVSEGFIHQYLKKDDPSISWEKYMVEGNLETA